MANASVSTPSWTGGDARPATEPVLRVRAVSKTYAARGVRALDPVDFDLYHGQFASIIGPSGCGKSTLLKVMAGLMRATTGEVTLRGTPVVGPRRDIGIMFQQATLLPWRTTLKNVLLPIEIRDGATAAQARTADAMALLEMVGLTGFEKVYPHELSGGMAQRAAICRMFITDPAGAAAGRAVRRARRADPRVHERRAAAHLPGAPGNRLHGHALDPRSGLPGRCRDRDDREARA